MPVTQQMDEGEGTKQWDSGSQLPSFYSPPSRPVAESRADGDVETGFSLPPKLAPPLNRRPENEDDDSASTTSSVRSSQPTGPPPPSLISPSFTPPSTPGVATPATSATRAAPPSEPRGVPVDSSIPSGGCGTKKPRLLETLPKVECIVRARIPTTAGAEMFLHLYHNNVDDKEHLAIVFGGGMRSSSLDAPRPGETERDRMIRGAYTGRLYPGRVTSGMLGGGGKGGRDGLRRDETLEEGLEQDALRQTQAPPLVRIHSECYTGETVWSARCDCGEQLDEAARLMSLPVNSAGGIIIYLKQEGRGIGLGEKLKAYNLQDLGSDTVEANLLLRHPADARSYGLATAMLMDLGQKDIRLLTNNPDKIRAVEGPNREIVVKERVAMVPLAWKGAGGFRSREVEGYLKTKIEKMGHMLDSTFTS